MKIDINKLSKLREDGWLMSQVHPTLPLTIWNYTNKTQWEGYWNEFTLMCRALVTDSDGNIVAYPLKKFFNYSELVAKNEVPLENLFTIYKKMDGSLIQLFHYKGNWVISSRGSFTSDHAKYALEILDTLGTTKGVGVSMLDKDCNYIFELIHPDTRIVVDYGNRKDLVLLAIIDQYGQERNINECINIFTLVEELSTIDGSPVAVDFDALKDLVNDDEEGYVIKFASGKRMKIKGDEYCRLHRIITMTSSYDIWETLKDNKDITELIERAPDEWLTWVYKTIGEIYVEYKKILQQVERDWAYGESKGLYRHEHGTDNGYVHVGRKKVAEYFSTCQHPAFMFNKLDGLDYDSKVWELCKPAHSKAFSI
jgi:RNA ligase